MGEIEPGFYWVKCDDEVTLAQYIQDKDGYQDSWFIIGNECAFYSDQLQVISERLISPVEPFHGS